MGGEPLVVGRPDRLITPEKATAVMSYPIYDGITGAGEGDVPLKMGAVLSRINEKVPLNIRLCKGAKVSLDYYPLPGILDRYEIRAMLHLGEEAVGRITEVYREHDVLNVCSGDIRLSLHISGFEREDVGNIDPDRFERKEGYRWTRTNAVGNTRT